MAARRFVKNHFPLYFLVLALNADWNVKPLEGTFRDFPFLSDKINKSGRVPATDFSIRCKLVWQNCCVSPTRALSVFVGNFLELSTLWTVSTHEYANLFNVTDELLFLRVFRTVTSANLNETDAIQHFLSCLVVAIWGVFWLSLSLWADWSNLLLFLWDWSSWCESQLIRSKWNVTHTSE